MNRLVTLATVALMLAPAGTALAKNDKSDKKGASFELRCPPGLAKKGACGGKVKVKTKRDGDKSKIKIEVKSDDFKRKIEIKGAQAARILEGTLTPDVLRTPVVAAPAPRSVAPEVSLVPEPRRLAVNRTNTTTLDSTETARSTTTTSTAAQPAAAVASVQTPPVATPSAAQAAVPSILAPRETAQSQVSTTQRSVERTDDGTSAKFVTPTVASVTLADGRELGRGDRFDDAYKNDYVVLRNPEIFNLPPLAQNRNYVRVGDTAVVIDGQSQEVVDFVTIAGLLVD